MRIPPKFERELEHYRKKGVLQKVDPSHLPSELIKQAGDLSSVNLLVLSCSDGHQFRDITSRTLWMADELKRKLKNELGLSGLGDDCLHWHARNGGPFALSVPELALRWRKKSPGKIDDVAYDTLCELDEGMDLKKLNTILLLPHACCGKTNHLFDSLRDYVEHLALSKERAMQEFELPSAQVIAQLQIHCSDGRLTFHFDYSSMVEDLRQKYPTFGSKQAA